MRSQLLKLYQSQHNIFNEVRNQFPNDDLAGPFLVSPNNKYTLQKNQLLVIGQETKGWGYDIDDLNKQMEGYEKFNLGINYYASPFWNVTRKLEKAIGNEHYSSVWTNISKFDVSGKRAIGKHEVAISKLDNILIDEINILKPNVCIFFTGPSFDYRLKRIFPSLNFKAVDNFNKNNLCQLSHPNLPELSFRSYHPNYLRRSKKENSFLQFMTTLSNL